MKKTTRVVITLAACVLARGTAEAGSAVVTNGRFTNIYVFPDPDKETWEEHFKKVDPARADQFTRAKIDQYTQELMRPQWPSYFDALVQYGVHPPRFFGSGVATKSC